MEPFLFYFKSKFTTRLAARFLAVLRAGYLATAGENENSACLVCGAAWPKAGFLVRFV